ncbi:MAG TPA: 4-hydroxy-tetrahydrodipicolinate reductase [Myxococcota bacterium]|nr:4-hydroxy-tetrahydrodipicolinate reductase [Myxococcota bacterium]
MSGTRRVAVVGALGRMGEHVRAALRDEPSLRLCAALESPGHPGVGRDLGDGIVVSDDPKSALRGSDVAIDFSIPAATLALAHTAADLGVALVTGTTGFSAAERAELARVAARIPVLAAPNFSIAVNVLFWLAREATRRLGPGYDAEIVELHHAQKRDAPSGTALRLAEAVAEARGVELEPRLVLERAGEIGARPAGAIAVQSVRGGDNPGEHTLLLLGRGERLELVHRAETREHFARGAVRAAAWLVGRPPGMHRFESVLGIG